MVIIWDDNLATGNKEIDLQHKEIFRRFNNFQTACKEGKGLDELASLFSFLHEYVSSHFALEEQLQVTHGYPEYLKHKEEHNGFIGNLRTLEEQLNNNGITTTLLMKTNMVMANWLTRHFTWTDRQLANFLHATMHEQG